MARQIARMRRKAVGEAARESAALNRSKSQPAVCDRAMIRIFAQKFTNAMALAANVCGTNSRQAVIWMPVKP